MMFVALDLDRSNISQVSLRLVADVILPAEPIAGQYG